MCFILEGGSIPVIALENLLETGKICAYIMKTSAGKLMQKLSNNSCWNQYYFNFENAINSTCRRGHSRQGESHLSGILNVISL